LYKIDRNGDVERQIDLERLGKMYIAGLGVAGTYGQHPFIYNSDAPAAMAMLYFTSEQICGEKFRWQVNAGSWGMFVASVNKNLDVPQTSLPGWGSGSLIVYAKRITQMI
jgi:hypothetical protein